jgi:hypothetical protein
MGHTHMCHMNAIRGRFNQSHFCSHLLMLSFRIVRGPSLSIAFDFLLSSARRLCNDFNRLRIGIETIRAGGPTTVGRSDGTAGPTRNLAKASWDDARHVFSDMARNAPLERVSFFEISNHIIDTKSLTLYSVCDSAESTPTTGSNRCEARFRHTSPGLCRGSSTPSMRTVSP